MIAHFSKTNIKKGIEYIKEHPFVINKYKNVEEESDKIKRSLQDFINYLHKDDKDKILGEIKLKKHIKCTNICSEKYSKFTGCEDHCKKEYNRFDILLSMIDIYKNIKEKLDLKHKFIFYIEEIEKDKIIYNQNIEKLKEKRGNIANEKELNDNLIILKKYINDTNIEQIQSTNILIDKSKIFDEKINLFKNVQMLLKEEKSNISYIEEIEKDKNIFIKNIQILEKEENVVNKKEFIDNLNILKKYINDINIQQIQSTSMLKEKSKIFDELIDFLKNNTNDKKCIEEINKYPNCQDEID
jgi:hypothetical protein